MAGYILVEATGRCERDRDVSLGFPDMAADAPPVQVVIVAYGPADALAACLEGLGGRYHCTIVDNGSSTEARGVGERFGARYIDPGQNLGFAAGANLAFVELPLAECDVLLLNPDAVVHPDSVERLRQFLHAEPRLACVAPAQRSREGEHLDPVYRPFPTPFGSCIEALGFGRWRRRRFVIGSVLLMSGAALADVGGFDERFFLYAEETDWQRRAVARGWVVRYCPEVVALHEKGGTDPDSIRRELRDLAGSERYIRKWYGRFGWQVFRFASVCGLLTRAVVLPGERRARAARRARIYFLGPERTARRAGVVGPPAARTPGLMPGVSG